MVYILNNLTIHDKEAYKRYVRAFMPILRRFGGRVLAAENRPVPIEGEWPYDRTVLLSFPSRESADQWAQSPEYLNIARDRKAGTKSNVVVLEELPEPE